MKIVLALALIGGGLGVMAGTSAAPRGPSYPIAREMLPEKPALSPRPLAATMVAYEN